MLNITAFLSSVHDQITFIQFRQYMAAWLAYIYPHCMKYRQSRVLASSVSNAPPTTLYE